jgi:hypothetical protein
MIGVVHDVRKDRSTWINLKELCTDDRVKGGPYTFRFRSEAQSVLSPETLTAILIPSVAGFGVQASADNDVHRRLELESEVQIDRLPSLDRASMSQDDAWRALIGVLTSLLVTDQVRLEAAQRLSYYVVAASTSQQQLVYDAVASLSDFQIIAIIRSVEVALEAGFDQTAEGTTRLLQYNPTMSKRIERLIVDRMMPASLNDAAVRAVEFMQQTERADLWSFVHPWAEKADEGLRTSATHGAKFSRRSRFPR